MNNDSREIEHGGHNDIINPENSDYHDGGEIENVSNQESYNTENYGDTGVSSTENASKKDYMKLRLYLI